MSQLVVSELSIYPLKSAAPVSLTSMTLDVMGPQWDRRWMVVDKNNRFLSQRRYPLMSQINCSLTDSGLVLSSTGMENLTVDCSKLKNEVSVNVWSDTVTVLDCGDEAAQWLSRLIAPDSRLVYMPDNCKRQVDTAYAALGTTVSFADGFPLLLISEASLNFLNDKLPQKISMQRFRPNIVVAGCEPFAEDSWSEIQIAGLNFSLVKPCSRCVIPSIDPATGRKQSSVLSGLRELRLRDGEVYFGQNVIHHGVGELALNDSIKIIE